MKTSAVLLAFYTAIKGYVALSPAVLAGLWGQRTDTQSTMRGGSGTEQFIFQVQVLEQRLHWSAAVLIVTPKDAVPVDAFLCWLPSFYLHAGFVSTYI